MSERDHDPQGAPEREEAEPRQAEPDQGAGSLEEKRTHGGRSAEARRLLHKDLVEQGEPGSDET